MLAFLNALAGQLEHILRRYLYEIWVGPIDLCALPVVGKVLDRTGGALPSQMLRALSLFWECPPV
jgi:hypothetical protein